jgi:hypothetical protein
MCPFAHASAWLSGAKHVVASEPRATTSSIIQRQIAARKHLDVLPVARNRHRRWQLDQGIPAQGAGLYRVRAVSDNETRALPDAIPRIHRRSLPLHCPRSPTLCSALCAPLLPASPLDALSPIGCCWAGSKSLACSVPRSPQRMRHTTPPIPRPVPCGQLCFRGTKPPQLCLFLWYKTLTLCSRGTKPPRFVCFRGTKPPLLSLQSRNLSPRRKQVKSAARWGWRTRPRRTKGSGQVGKKVEWNQNRNGLVMQTMPMTYLPCRLGLSQRIRTKTSSLLCRCCIPFPVCRIPVCIEDLVLLGQTREMIVGVACNPRACYSRLAAHPLVLHLHVIFQSCHG